MRNEDFYPLSSKFSPVLDIPRLEALANSPRYKGTVLENYVNDLKIITSDVYKQRLFSQTTTSPIKNQFWNAAIKTGTSLVPIGLGVTLGSVLDHHPNLPLIIKELPEFAGLVGTFMSILMNINASSETSIILEEKLFAELEPVLQKIQDLTTHDHLFSEPYGEFDLEEGGDTGYQL